jgi:hypothetical protein
MMGGVMAKPMRVMLEMGPKGKKVVAVAPDWPGLERGAKTEEEAIERLRAYVPRYAPVARLAGLADELAASSGTRVVERYPGVGSTDFWGISFAFSEIDQKRVTSEALERELALMQASWAFFDQVRARVSAEMQKGPRGGGRERDHIVRHVLVVEQDWSRKLGLQTPEAPLLDSKELKAYRAAYTQAIRAFQAEGKMAGKVAKWPLRYLIRHTAFHTLDHAWEMEDKDLSKTRMKAER